MPLIVNFWAAPSSGKTTAAAGLFYHLKCLGLNAELALEYAKDLVYNERKRELTDQIYIFAKQRSRIERVAKQCDIIISDGPVLMSETYFPELFPDEHRRMLKWAHDQYPSINFLVERQFPYQDVGRTQTEAEANVVHQNIIDIMDKYEIDYIPIPGNEAGLKIALDAVLERVQQN